jgi:raffinose/stachyose/melibiose transport system permease protein
MDGKTALAFARERYAYESGDRHRVQNQQDVLKAIINKATSDPSILTKYTTLLNSVSGYFQTNIDMTKISEIVKIQLDKMPSWTIKQYSLNGSGSKEYTYSMGKRNLYVMIPDYNTVKQASNYINGMTFGDYPFIKSVLYSFLITIISTFLILLCTSMCAWFIVRVNNIVCKIIYYLCIFSMVVPFQMVMFTLSKTADTLYLNNPFTISIIYLGFGAGLSIFLFSGFMKSIPIEIEEAAAIDGCNPVQMFFKVVMPICKPIYVSVAILQIMWIWNDYLLPTLILPSEFRTIPMAVQYLRGGYGAVDMGAMMAVLVLAIIPIVIFYLVCQKHIIEGIAAGAVKG